MALAGTVLQRFCGALYTPARAMPPRATPGAKALSCAAGRQHGFGAFAKFPWDSEGQGAGGGRRLMRCFREQWAAAAAGGARMNADTGEERAFGGLERRWRRGQVTLQLHVSLRCSSATPRHATLPIAWPPAAARNLTQPLRASCCGFSMIRSRAPAAQPVTARAAFCRMLQRWLDGGAVPGATPSD